MITLILQGQCLVMSIYGFVQYCCVNPWLGEGGGYLPDRATYT